MDSEKLNCWQYKGCGREPGGAAAQERGACPAATDATCDGINGGTNAGRFCWAVAQTAGEDPRQPVPEPVAQDCQRCSFFRRVKYEEGPHLQLLKPGLGNTSVAELHRLLNNTTMLIGICRDVFGCLAVHPLLVRVVEHACAITRSSSACAYLADGTGGELLLEVHTGQVARPERIGLDEHAPVAEAVRTGRLWKGPVALPGGAGTAFVAAIPIAGADEPAGALELLKLSGAFSTDDEWFLREFSLSAGLGIENARHVNDLRQLRKFDRAKSRFVALLMHHISSPLATIACSLQALSQLGEKLSAADRSELIGNSLDRINSIQALSRKLLDLAAIRSGTSLAGVRPVRPIEPLRQEVEARRPLAGEHGVELVLTQRGDEASVLADPDGLRLIFANLLGNAIKYSAGAGKRVDVDLLAAGGTVRIRIRDRGIGIPAQEQVKVFEEFHRGGNVSAAQASGFGLGLAVVRELVDRYRGRIELDSEVGKGTTVCVEFPAVPAADG